MSRDNIGPDRTRDWGKLPYVALAIIFTYLPDRDKFNASLVNRTWTEGFSWPGNWRHREMIFYGACEEVVAKEKAFSQRFGAQLHFLRLRCWSPAQGSVLETYLKNVAGVLEVLSQNSSLREIHVADVEGLGYFDNDLITVNDLLFESERRAEGKARAVTIIANLIRTQNELRLLNLQEVDCAWDIGLELISAAAESSAANTTLHTLLLSGTFDQLPSRVAVSSDTYLLAMASFRKLTHLRIDYRCLSCKLLDILGLSLGHCFRKFAILCSDEDGPELPNLDDEAWRTLSLRCPFLRVDLTIGVEVCSKIQSSQPQRAVVIDIEKPVTSFSIVLEGVDINAGWRNILLRPGMPLASLSIDGEMSIYHSEYWDTTPTLELLLREYRNTLEHLSMSLSQRSGGMTAEKLTTEIISRALKLGKLKTLHLSGPIDCGAVKTLYGLLDKSHGTKHLQRVTLTVWCSSEEEIDRLLKANRIAAQNRVSTKTEVRLVPML